MALLYPIYSTSFPPVLLIIISLLQGKGLSTPPSTKSEKGTEHCRSQTSNRPQGKLIWGFSASIKAQLNTKPLPHTAPTLWERLKQEAALMNRGYLERLQNLGLRENQPTQTSEQKAARQTCLLQVLRALPQALTSARTLEPHVYGFTTMT